MNDNKLTKEDILNLLGHYRKNLQCLSQFACSEDLDLIEALTDNLLVHVEIEMNKFSILSNKERRKADYLVWPDDSVMHKSDYCEITYAYKGDDFQIVKYSELTPSQRYALGRWEV